METKIDGGSGNQIYLNPETPTLYNWTRESGEPAASHEGRDRLILCAPVTANPTSMALWLLKHRAEIDDIIALWDGRQWQNAHDETSLAIQRLQDEFNRDFADGVVAED